MMSADTFFMTIVGIVVYAWAGFMTAMIMDSAYNSDDFDTAMAGILWPLVLAWHLFIAWPVKFLAFFAKGFSRKVKALNGKRSRRSSSVEVK